MPEIDDQPVVAASEYQFMKMARPWPRFWSRSLDTAIWSWPLGFAIGYLFPAHLSWFIANDKQGYLLSILLMPLIMVFDALCLALFGNTPGRAIAGIRVETIRHERLSVPLALTRNALVYVKGLGLGIPLVALFTQISGYNKVKNGEQTSWDRDLHTRAYDLSSNVIRTTICAVLVLTAVTSQKIFAEMAQPNQIAATGSPLAPYEDPIAEQLKEAAASVKAHTVDEVTRLDSAEAEGRTFIFNYSITGRDLSDAEMRKLFNDRIRPNACADKDMSLLMKDHQITYRYNYLLPKSSKPLDFEVQWADCTH